MLVRRRRARTRPRRSSRRGTRLWPGLAGWLAAKCVAGEEGGGWFEIETLGHEEISAWKKQKRHCQYHISAL